jgi:hypothetical protein
VMHCAVYFLHQFITPVQQNALEVLLLTPRTSSRGRWAALRSSKGISSTDCP